MGPGDRPASRRLHPHSGEVPALRSGVGGARPHRARDPTRRAMDARAAHRRIDGRDRAPAGPHAAAVLRGSRPRGAHRPAVRASRQAARDDRLARRRRPVDAGRRGRQALWPRRRRRRLCGVRGVVRDRRAACARHFACTLRGHDRDVRGKRQLRPSRVSGRVAAAPR